MNLSSRWWVSSWIGWGDKNQGVFCFSSGTRNFCPLLWGGYIKDVWKLCFRKAGWESFQLLEEKLFGCSSWLRFKISTRYNQRWREKGLFEVTVCSKLKGLEKWRGACTTDESSNDIRHCSTPENFGTKRRDHVMSWYRDLEYKIKEGSWAD